MFFVSSHNKVCFRRLKKKKKARGQGSTESSSLRVVVHDTTRLNPSGDLNKLIN